MRYFLIALGFLTVLPVRIKKIRDYEFGKSLAYFPLVGTAIGLILTLSLYIFSLILPHIVATLLILIILAGVTGGIHLDGFADTCDGFCGSRQKQKTLGIMRDSHIGMMGAMWLILLLLLKFTLFYSTPGFALGKTLIVMATLGRWFQVLACYSAGYAQDSQGKGKSFVEHIRKRELLISTAFSLAVVILAMGSKGIALFMLSTIAVLPLINYIKRRIGGMTGDTVGAVSEVSEVIVLFIALILAALSGETGGIG